MATEGKPMQETGEVAIRRTQPDGKCIKAMHPTVFCPSSKTNVAIAAIAEFTLCFIYHASGHIKKIT